MSLRSLPWSLTRASFALLLATAIHLAACSDATVVTTPPADSGSSDAGADDAHVQAEAATDAGLATRVRLVAANTTSGTKQSYELPGVRIFQGLHPDIVMIQEFDYASGDLRSFVDTAFGTDFVFFVEPRSGGIPNGIVSRYPILESGAWADASVPDRAFAYARIDVPGPIDLWAVSVHLLTTGATARSTEAKALRDYVKANVPAGDYLAIGGDFNAESTGEQAVLDLSNEVVVDGPFPADQSGHTNTSANRSKPHDLLFARENLDAREVPVTIGAASLDNGLVFDSRVFTPLADVAPVLVSDSGTSGMQHMPVVRDFKLGGK
jgi:endonuclease/exonuclease/phosphatase family metal-dependent hydrolase